jgi:hypothetical protein
MVALPEELQVRRRLLGSELGTPGRGCGSRSSGWGRVREDLLRLEISRETVANVLAELSAAEADAGVTRRQSRGDGGSAWREAW